MTSYSDKQNQYLNIRIANDSIVPYTPATYTRNNTSTLLEQPRLYKLSVDRFKIPTNNIPLIIAEHDNGTPVNDLVYVFEMSNDSGVTWTQQTVQYINNGLQPTDPFYYYIYTYNRFISMLNETLASLFSLLYTDADPAYNEVPPHFEFDSFGQKISLVVPGDLFDVAIGTYRIRYNFPLLRFFQGFESNIITQGQLYEFRIYNRFNNNVPVNLSLPAGTPVNYLNMIPDYNALIRWNELDSIQILTNIPVGQQFVETSDTTSSTSSKPILTDFIVLYPDNNSYAATTLDYTTTERSYYDLYGNTPIRNIQLTLLWTNFKGQTFPLYISKGDAISIKLLFTVRPDI